MASLLLNEPDQGQAITPITKPTRGSTWLMAGLLAALLTTNLPAFLCMPLDADVTEWDLCARTVLWGGVFYRDALENNLPGMLWLHLAIRPLVGWGSEAMRAVDLGVLAAVVILLVGWLPQRTSAAARFATAFVLCAFYLATSEWCHCQRDTWMLLPALLALKLRRRQVEAQAGAGAGVWFWPFMEGVLWGAAFWIKPFVAVPALVCWFVAARDVSRITLRGGRRLAMDAVLCVGGGLVAGGLGCAWFIASGAWTDFWDIMWGWNRQYLAHDVTGGDRLLIAAGVAIRLSPALLVHFAALPLACRDLRRGGRQILLSALYLGWFFQALLLQHLYDYVHVPALLLAIAVLCQHIAAACPGPARTCLAALLVLAIFPRMPALTANRVGLWHRCLGEGSTPELRDRLTLLPRENWADLERVRSFLADKGIRDGELTCYNMRTVRLYMDLGVRPSTRYFLLENILAIVPGKRDLVCADLTASPQRYFVCDVKTTSWNGRAGAAEPRYPREKLLLEAGRYAVFQLDGHSMPAWIEKYISF
jgi:hypothetical protein